MTWSPEHWLEDLRGEYGRWDWICACGAAGWAVRQDLAGADYSAHMTAAAR